MTRQTRTRPADPQPPEPQPAEPQPAGPQPDGPDAGGPGAGGLDLDYEQARDELAEVVRRLEGGDLGLDESLALWERGEALAATCERHLAGARHRVEAALSRADHDASTG